MQFLFTAPLDHKLVSNISSRNTNFTLNKTTPSLEQRLQPQAVSNILRGERAFGQDEHNVESFSSSGSL